MIANAHLVWADLSNDGARCEQCLQLAALCSTAVDFPKSGVPAKFPDVSKLTWPICGLSVGLGDCSGKLEILCSVAEIVVAPIVAMR